MCANLFRYLSFIEEISVPRKCNECRCQYVSKNKVYLMIVWHLELSLGMTFQTQCFDYFCSFHMNRSVVDVVNALKNILICVCLNLKLHWFECYDPFNVSILKYNVFLF